MRAWPRPSGHLIPSLPRASTKLWMWTSYRGLVILWGREHIRLPGAGRGLSDRCVAGVQRAFPFLERQLSDFRRSLPSTVEKLAFVSDARCSSPIVRVGTPVDTLAVHRTPALAIESGAVRAPCAQPEP
jgi:hypothetical protein